MNEHRAISANRERETMRAPTLLIVSSYGRDCGVARYVEYLEGPLKEIGTWHVEIAPLPVSLLRNRLPTARRLAAKALRQIAARAAVADVVNIQFEPGLMGADPFEIWRRLRLILKRAKRVIITYHTSPIYRGTQASLRHPLRYLNARARQFARNYVFNRLFGFIRRQPKKFHHIVQTGRERFMFSMMGIPESTITDLPLSFLSRAMKEQARNSAFDRSTALGMAGVTEGVVIGCFGFIAAYKGIETAIKAMQFLPEDWHLLIVGGLHPEGIRLNVIDQPYLGSLLRLLTPSFDSPGGEHTYALREAIAQRVHFCGMLDNDRFTSVMNGCDAVILPYAEVGQSSSGPASMALDLGKPLYCSRNEAFRELAKYAGDAIGFFEIGNYLELAQKLKSGDQSGEKAVSARATFSEIYNVEKRAQVYIDACEKLRADVVFS